jgi:hypothetical protein
MIKRKHSSTLVTGGPTVSATLAEAAGAILLLGSHCEPSLQKNLYNINL